jgi:hypothetical protein
LKFKKSFIFVFKKTEREREREREREESREREKKNDRGKGRSSKGFLSQNTLFAENLMKRKNTSSAQTFRLKRQQRQLEVKNIQQKILCRKLIFPFD